MGDDGADSAGRADFADVESVDFVTLGAFSPALAREVVARSSRRIPLPCRLHAAGPQVPPACDLAGRGQTDADRLLAALEEDARRRLEWERRPALWMALTALDLGNPVFTFFFGRARRGGRAGLVSVARLSPSFYGLPEDGETTARRAVLEVLHELGHLAGLPHCDDLRCLMHVVHDVEGIDARGGTPCDACAQRMPSALRLRP